MKAKKWSVEIYLSEHDRETRAEARLHTQDATGLKGVGWAHRNPVDHDVPEIGDELAAGRALADLARHLLQTANEDVEEAVHHAPVGA